MFQKHNGAILADAVGLGKTWTASLAMFNKLKSGSKTTIQKLKNEGSISQKFNKDNFDLITWFIIS